ncbi:heavy metal response regulator transcription factor [Candidatus Viadribacter manganicus]|uniref:Two-component system response regulator n=1 Tax=Candidatus Viadribacter manganicus TaxID=1759059 RepID=A0A1B1AGR0_9PROT|nr:heavy metal response regulator transcription factor [Candidatus Viadribacter manganicus]ANP45735.1 two-component system response regulator [Candidatus Viadribacter manganicus]
MRLLVIEDQEQTAKLLRRGLNEAGYLVDVCCDGVDGLGKAKSAAYDLLILDIMLPKLDGWGILAGLRETDRETPVLVLTARESIDDRVRGLSLGADDYLIKPFSFDELLARVRALLRRRSSSQTGITKIDDFSFDPMRLTVCRGGVSIDLTVKEVQLLELLVRHQGDVLSRDFIAEHVWQMSLDSESNVIDVAIARLRKKLDDPFERKLVHTVKGRGYVFR